ncbi:hypothetical protein IF650_13070 [Cellulosimicrobium terreum]|nr:hypothetical protein [Cellulosimicrobium terreum]
MLVYATTTDLQADPWGLSPVPSNAGGLIRAASLLVSDATLSAVYDTDETGLPTDARVAEAFRDAVCSQVVTWVRLGIDPDAAGADAATTSGRVTVSKSFGPASVTYVGVESAVAERARLATELTSGAAGILRAAGLDTRVRVTG